MSSFLAFVLANLISIAYVDLAVNPRAISAGHVWPIAVMLMIAAFIAAIVARVTAPVSA